MWNPYIQEAQMPKTNIIQTDFLAGEISPRMEMQDNLEGRKHGVSFMENFFTHLQGTAETSRGTEWVDTVSGYSGRMFGFPVSLLTGYMVVVADGRIRVFGPTGLVKPFDNIDNGDFDQGGADWTVDSSEGSAAVFLFGGVLLTGGYLAATPVSIQQSQAIGTTPWTLAVVIASGDGLVNISVGTADGLSDVLDEDVYGPGEKLFEDLAAASVTLWVRITLEAGSEDVTISEVHLYDRTLTGANFACPWVEQSETESIQAHMLPNESAMILTSADHPPQVLTVALGVWTFSVYTITSTPSEWGALNYPPAIGFFGGRMWLGGVASDPSLFWGSKPGSYDNFTLGTAADDAIEQRLTKSGAIRWIAGGPGLLIGTSTAEYVISSSDGVLVPGDINATVQSTYGSYPAQALEIGNEVMHITPDGRKVRSIEYEWSKDAWKSRDITYASEHITAKGNDLLNLVYMANPDSILMGITRAGALISGTYEAHSKNTGFARRSTQGRIVSMGTVNFGGADELWMLVDRGGPYLEVEKERHPNNTKLDSHMVFTSVTEITGGLVPHLAGKTCQVLVDGAVQPDVIPVGEGTFEVEYAGNEIKIGLQISSSIITLPWVDRISNLGTTRSMKKRMTEVWVKIIDSWRPKINGQRPPNRRVQTLMGEAEAALTESVEVSNEGWDGDALVTIEQDLPLKTEVAGWFGRILQEET